MHRSYVAGWVLAAVVACVVAVSPLPLLTRTLLALYVGPILGLLVHLGAMVWQARSVSNSGNAELENILINNDEGLSKRIVMPNPSFLVE